MGELRSLCELYQSVPAGGWSTNAGSHGRNEADWRISSPTGRGAAPRYGFQAEFSCFAGTALGRARPGVDNGLPKPPQGGLASHAQRPFRESDTNETLATR
jgi:hypothetical protein